MTGPQFWLFAVLAPLATGLLGYLAGWLVRRRAVELREDAAYDRGWENCKQALGFGSPAEPLVNDPGPPAARRPGRHASTQLPDPPKDNGTPFLSAPVMGSTIRRKTS